MHYIYYALGLDKQAFSTKAFIAGFAELALVPYIGVRTGSLPDNSYKTSSKNKQWAYLAKVPIECFATRQDANDAEEALLTELKQTGSWHFIANKAIKAQPCMLGYRLTKEQLIAASQRSKEIWQRDGHRARMSALQTQAQKAYWQNLPDSDRHARGAISTASIAGTWENAEIKEKLLAVRQSDEFKAKLSASLKAAAEAKPWQAERIAKQAEIASALWQDEQYIAKQLAIRKSPEYKAKLSESLKGKPKSAEQIAKRKATMLAKTHARLASYLPISIEHKRHGIAHFSKLQDLFDFCHETGTKLHNLEKLLKRQTM